MAAGPVPVNPKARATPLAVSAASSAQTAAGSRRPQRRSLQVGSFQRRQRDESGRTGHGGDHESMQAGEDRAGEHLAEQTWFALIRSLQRAEVPCPVPLVDDGGRVAEPNQDEVENQASGAAVAVEEGMNLFEAAVRIGQRLGERRMTGVEGVDTAHPGRHLCGYQRP